MKGSTFRKDLTGKTFGYLTVVGFDYCQKNRKSVWKTVCSCNRKHCLKEKSVLGQLLVNGHTKSCGGFRRERKVMEIWEKPARIDNRKWYSIRYGAFSRGIEFDITPKFAEDLFDKQNGKCALSGQNITLYTSGQNITASLDRIDSSKGYVNGNVEWIHKDLQRMKNDINKESFLNWIALIYANNFKK